MNRKLKVTLTVLDTVPAKFPETKEYIEKRLYRKEYEQGLRKRKLVCGRDNLFCWFSLDDGCLCLMFACLLRFCVNIWSAFSCASCFALESR